MLRGHLDTTTGHRLTGFLAMRTVMIFFHFVLEGRLKALVHARLFLDQKRFHILVLHLLHLFINILNKSSVKMAVKDRTAAPVALQLLLEEKRDDYVNRVLWTKDCLQIYIQ